MTLALGANHDYGQEGMDFGRMPPRRNNTASPEGGMERRQLQLVVDLERAKYAHCGLGQFTLHLGRALLAQMPGSVTPTLLLPPRCTTAFQPGAFRLLPAKPWRKEAVQRWWRPFVSGWSSTPPFHLWHATHQDTRFWPLDRRTPVVLTIHDLNFLQTKSAGTIRRRLAQLQSKIDRATVLTTGSQHAAGVIRHHLRIGNRPLRIIPHGVCLEHHHTAERPPSVPEGSPFLFTIGDIRRSKNFHVLVEMLVELPEWRLVIAGSTKDSYAEEIATLAQRLQLTDRVTLTGRVREEERLWLYQNCGALVFPSLAEGFGLPLIEAMHCGKPVFSSRCDSLPEVGGDVAFYWDNFDACQMAARVRTGLAIAAGSPDLAARAQARAAEFTWERAARQYLAVYQEFARQ